MALRVLLADESTTIKKVIQLALQDYGVEVKSVPVGLDVIPVAKTFQPDLIFVDVLLQKKSGYEVSKEIKDDAQLTSTPVVLMWSGFMEIDETKAQASRADRRLEKPFDAENLRQIVKDLVPRTLNNKISSYLSFPKLPDFADEPAGPNLVEVPTEKSSPALESSLALPEVNLKSEDDIYSIPEISESEILLETAPEDQFSNVPLSATKGPQMGPEETWSHQDLSKFKIEVPKDQGPAADLDKYMIPAEELNLAKVESSGDFEEVTFVAPRPQTPPAKPQTSSATSEFHPSNKTPSEPVPLSSSPGVRSAMDQVLAEKVLREEAQAVLEKVLWQILPDICERVVREELGKLLKDVEKSV